MLLVLQAFTLLAAALPVSGSAIPANLQVRQNGACQNDNLYKCFSSNAPIASVYCSVVLGVGYPAGTTTATQTVGTATVTTTTTLTQTTTQTVSDGTLTETEATAQTTTALITTTTTVTAAVAKRQLGLVGPACLQVVGLQPTSYQPAAQISACSCIGYKTVTATTPAATATVVRMFSANRLCQLTR